MRNILLESLETPVRGRYDVIVAGGGVAGVAAARAAAMNGASVLLIEKTIQLGGLATIGMIAWYEPLCDGLGNRVVDGMALELMQRAVRYSANTLDAGWKTFPAQTDKVQGRCCCHFSPGVFALILDEWIQEYGVDVLLDTVVVRPVSEGKRMTGLVVENKTGRGCYATSTIIDATGDCEIAWKAGLPTEYGENYLTNIAYLNTLELYRNAIEKQNVLLGRVWHKNGADLWGKGHPDHFPKGAYATAEEITAYVLEGRKQLFEDIKKTAPESRDVVLPNMIQLRKVRRLTGVYELTEQDAGKDFADSIALVSDFHRVNQLYQVPYRTLYADGCENLLTCGRSISSSGWAWEVTRVIPSAVLTGQAAGCAAAIAAQDRCPVESVDISKLQQTLKNDGVRLK